MRSPAVTTARAGIAIGAAVALTVLGLASGAGSVAGAVLASRAGACELLTTAELGTALGSTFQAGSAEPIGTGITCGFDATGSVRGATVRVARGKQARVAMATTLAALRDTLRTIGSRPPTKVAGLGRKAYYSLDEFLGEGSIEVLDGKTFLQITAIVTPGTETAVVSEAVLKGLAEQALTRAK